MKLYISILMLCFSLLSNAQTTIKGTVKDSKGTILPFTTVLIKGTSKGTSVKEDGTYTLATKKTGKLKIEASFNGFSTQRKTVSITKDISEVIVNFTLTEISNVIDEVIVTGTRTQKRKTESPIIVNVISDITLDNVQACNLSEGLKFQTGLRVETDCQTCNYTQLRMNGLAGGYSQILINGRPIFSPLTGLYGLEQIPTNMIDKIEVVRGAGSALYGSGAVGGTVNVFTKIPEKNNYSASYTYQSIKGTPDRIIAANGTLLTKKKNAGGTVFFNYRNRGLFDANGDNFSELPQLKNTAIGANLFVLPNDNQKLEGNFSYIKEYRYGGEITDKPAHLTEQAEERTHHVYAGNLDYQINFNKDKTSFIAYAAGQHTDRDHFTGVRPNIGDINPTVTEYLNNPPYGISATTTLQGGIQMNHKLEKFIKGDNVITFGAEYVQDDVDDIIETYNYQIDQITNNIGVFLQSDWKINNKWTVLTGLRYDNHKLDALNSDRITRRSITNNVFSPRASLLFKPFENTQLRATWGKGFRAPQAFDADLHIAFAGGGISRVILADDLTKETSESVTFSFNYDKPTEHYIYGFTFESFYTRLDDAFILENIGKDAQDNEIFEKSNGKGATVHGVTVEGRLNYDGILQLEGGFTYQSSLFDDGVENSDALPTTRNFLRTPNTYGFATATCNMTPKFKTSLNYVYTGRMDVLHLASPNNLTNDEYFKSPSFHNLGLKSAYTFDIQKAKSFIEVFGGVKNIFDSYQEQFDVSKDRDSNFVFGPATPRTFFVGLKIGSK